VQSALLQTKQGINEVRAEAPSFDASKKHLDSWRVIPDSGPLLDGFQGGCKAPFQLGPGSFPHDFLCNFII